MSSSISLLQKYYFFEDRPTRKPNIDDCPIGTKVNNFDRLIGWKYYVKGKNHNFSIATLNSYNGGKATKIVQIETK